MSATSPAPAALVNCPKCGAGRTLAQYRHVEGGICFLCNGDGKVTPGQAAGWEKAQIREALWAMRAVGTAPAASVTARPRKAVDLGLSFIRPGAQIEKCEEEGWFCLICEIEGKDERGDDMVSNYAVFFEVVNGRVKVGDVQNGVIAYKARIEKALQAKLRK